MEAGVKILAMGLIFGKKTYLKKGWNVLDFIIAVSSLLEILIPQQANISMIRTLRILRPLKAA